MAWFTFRRGKVPLGNSNLATAVALGPLPRFSTIAYPQFRVLSPLNATEGRQLYTNPAVPWVGVGGLIQGGIVFQSLTANPNPNQ